MNQQVQALAVPLDADMQMYAPSTEAPSTPTPFLSSTPLPRHAPHGGMANQLLFCVITDSYETMADCRGVMP